MPETHFASHMPFAVGAFQLGHCTAHSDNSRSPIVQVSCCCHCCGFFFVGLGPHLVGDMIGLAICHKNLFSGRYVARRPNLQDASENRSTLHDVS